MKPPKPHPTRRTQGTTGTVSQYSTRACRPFTDGWFAALDRRLSAEQPLATLAHLLPARPEVRT